MAQRKDHSRTHRPRGQVPHSSDDGYRVLGAWHSCMWRPNMCHTNLRHTLRLCEIVLEMTDGLDIIGNKVQNDYVVLSISDYYSNIVL